MNTEDLIHNLSLAASAVSKVLTQAGLKHAFISGYAVSRLVGGGERRPTEDVDLIIAADGREIQTLCLGADDKFSMRNGLKLQYTTDKLAITIELMRGGQSHLKLPDANTAAVVYMDTGIDDIQVSILHPRLLISTKINRWKGLLDSTRPKTVPKGLADEQDMHAILNWLRENDEKVDLRGYGTKERGELVPGVALLYARCPALRGVLEECLEDEDLGVVVDSSSGI